MLLADIMVATYAVVNFSYLAQCNLDPHLLSTWLLLLFSLTQFLFYIFRLEGVWLDVMN